MKAWQPEPGELVRAVELADHDRTRTYAEGILLRLRGTHYVYNDGCSDTDPPGQLIVTLLDHDGGVVTFLCEWRRSEWLGSLWLEKVNENDNEPKA